MANPFTGPTLAYAQGVADAMPDDEGEQPTHPPALKLAQILQSSNLVPDMDEEEVAEISTKALDGYKLDDDSRAEWKERNKSAINLAMLLTDEKNYPFTGAANVKYPLLTTAALQFNARAYPAIVQGERVAKCKVNGDDPDGQKEKRAERVSEHLSWQLTSEMPEWEEDTDRLLMTTPIVGVAFRKVYYDPTLSRKCSRLVHADKLVINYKARSLEDVPRISEEMWLYPYEIDERIRDGRFVEFEYGDAPAQDGSKTDDNSPHKFIEQHRLIDMDKDGYPEPYIVTVHIESRKVCRIVPNFTQETVRVDQSGKIISIRRQDYYTKYPFLPSPDGGVYGMGLGWLLLSTNEAINTTLNEMLDAGHLSNIQGGFVSAQAGLRDRKITLSKGEWKVLNTSMPLNQAIYPMKYDGPSPVLFQLLGLLIDQGKDLSSVKDIMAGDTDGKVMQPTTVLAMIEQGMKVFNAIFKRVHRAVKHELDLHARINFEHLTPEQYNQFFDDPTQQFDPKADYNMADMNITPVSDPSVATSMQKLAKSQVIAEIAADNPNINQVEATRRRLEAAEIDDIDKLMAQQKGPDPFEEAMKQMTLLKTKGEIDKLESDAIFAIAQAAGIEGDQHLAVFQAFVQSLQAQHNMEQDNAQAGQGQLPAMAGAPGDALGGGMPPAGGDSGQPTAPGSDVQQPQPGGAPAAAPVSVPSGPS